LKLRAGLATAPAVPSAAAGEQLPPRMTFHTVWPNLDADQEPAMIPVTRLLADAGYPLLSDGPQAQSPLLASRNPELTGPAGQRGREGLLAAWLSLHHRVGPAGVRQTKEAAEEYATLGYRVAELLGKSGEQADRVLAARIRAELDQLGTDPPGGAGSVSDVLF